MKFTVFAFVLILANLNIIQAFKSELETRENCPCGFWYYLEYYIDDGTRIHDDTACYCPFYPINPPIIIDPIEPIGPIPIHHPIGPIGPIGPIDPIIDPIVPIAETQKK